MAAFIHYVGRRVIVIDYRDSSHPWFAHNQPDDQGFVAPSYHVTRSTTGPASRIVAGDSIWLVSQLYSPWGSLPPALDGMIVVDTVGPRPQEDGQLTRGFQFTAAEGSKWFPLFDARPCLRQLATVDAMGRLQPLRRDSSQPIGRFLRQIRELADPAPLWRLAAEIETAGFAFVSYRLIDGTEAAFSKVTSLLADGHAVFWDRWSLPRRLAERRELLSDVAMTDYIDDRIEAASTVWGIGSPMYDEDGSYSAREKAHAERLGKFRNVPIGRRSS